MIPYAIALAIVCPLAVCAARLIHGMTWQLIVIPIRDRTR